MQDARRDGFDTTLGVFCAGRGVKKKTLRSRPTVSSLATNRSPCYGRETSQDTGKRLAAWKTSPRAVPAAARLAPEKHGNKIHVSEAPRCFIFAFRLGGQRGEAMAIILYGRRTANLEQMVDLRESRAKRRGAGLEQRQPHTAILPTRETCRIIRSQILPRVSREFSSFGIIYLIVTYLWSSL